MNIETIIGFTRGKDCFGAERLYINPNVASKRKAWNWCLKNGFSVCENPRYLKKDNVYIHNNSLLNHLLIEVNRQQADGESSTP